MEVGSIGLIGILAVIAGGAVLLMGRPLDPAFWSLPVASIAALGGLAGRTERGNV